MGRAVSYPCCPPRLVEGCNGSRAGAYPSPSVPCTPFALKVAGAAGGGCAWLAALLRKISGIVLISVN